MKTYEISKENYNDVLFDVNLNLAAYLTGKPIGSKAYGDGLITEVKNIQFAQNKEPAVIVQIQFAEKQSTYYLTVGLATKALVLSDEIMEELIQYLGVIRELDTYFQAEFVAKALIEKAERDAQLAAQKAEEEAKKKEIKRQAQMKKVLDNLKGISRSAIRSDDDFYVALGWLAKHIGTISASIPDYTEAWFVSRFGADATYNKVDSTKKTTGGFSMKWNPSFSVSFKASDDCIPLIIAEKAIGKKKINDTAFVFDLIENYGFAFGKTQDLDRILKYVPSTKLDKFNLGFAS